MVTNALRFVYGWIALDGLNQSESIQGLSVFLLGLPGIFLLLPAGVWADRVDRRKLLFATQLSTVAIMVLTGIFISFGALSLPLVIVSALAAGVATALGSPVRTSLLPELVPKRLLLSAIALNALALTMSLVLGSFTAQLVGDRFDFDGVFFYFAILLIIGTLALVPMKVPEHATTESTRATMSEAVGQGFKFVWENSALRALFFLLSIAGLVMNALMFVTLQAVVKGLDGYDAGDAAPLMALIGVGLAISSVFVMRQTDVKNMGAHFMRAMMVGTTTLALMGRVTEYWHLIVLCVLMGLAGGVFINMNQGLIQSNTPQPIMGRVMGLYVLVQAGLTPIGALILGLLASAIGANNTMTICASIGFCLVVATYIRSPELRVLTTTSTENPAR